MSALQKQDGVSNLGYEILGLFAAQGGARLQSSIHLWLLGENNRAVGLPMERTLFHAEAQTE